MLVVIGLVLAAAAVAGVVILSGSSIAILACVGARYLYSIGDD